MEDVMPSNQTCESVPLRWRVLMLHLHADLSADVRFLREDGAVVSVTFPKPPARLAEYQAKLGAREPDCWFDSEPWL